MVREGSTSGRMCNEGGEAELCGKMLQDDLADIELASYLEGKEENQRGYPLCHIRVQYSPWRRRGFGPYA